jgi:hypothetical protein
MCVELKTSIGMLTVSYLVVFYHQYWKAFWSGSRDWDKLIADKDTVSTEEFQNASELT